MLMLIIRKGEKRLEKKIRRSKRREAILKLLSENIGGLTTKQIITKLDPDKGIYNEDGTVNRQSSAYKSWSRTLLALLDMGAITKVTQETVWKKAP